MRRPTIEQLRQHPWVNVDYTVAVPRIPVPKDGTNDDLFEPTVKPETLSYVSRPALRPLYAVLKIEDHVQGYVCLLLTHQNFTKQVSTGLGKVNYHLCNLCR